ncbi:MAG: ABC transporter ATP-binding protein [Chloroflexi bacterium]|nr:ABC transporter ATP-binding protein [Chloroflexota bacterium]
MNISVENLTFTYPTDVVALSGVSLDLRAGAQVALLGQNGAGKTTLVKHFNGLLKPTRGSVRVGDWDTRAHSIAQMARRVGLVFQNPDDQIFKTRVWDEIAFGPTNLKFAPEEVKTRVEHALAVCELDAVREQHPYDLPLWQRRWVAIAAVVAMQTPVVVLDEPTTGQDAFGLARLARLLDAWRAQNVTVVAVTHDVDFAVEYFSDLCLMSQGQVIARGDARVFADAEVVRRAALDLPQLMRLAQALEWRTLPVRADAFLDAWRAERSG